MALLIPLVTVSAFAQSSNEPKPVEIVGVVQSFRANILDVKPATTPSVWVTIPADLKVDRSALKPDAKVTVEARWVDSCYLATQVTIEK